MNNQQGSVLLEALIAILIFSMGVLAIMGLQAASMKNTVDAKFRAQASFLADEILSQLWVDRANLASYNNAPPATWTAHLAQELPAGGGNIVIDNDPTSGEPRATITVNWKLPGGAQHQYVSIAQINGAN